MSRFVYVFHPVTDCRLQVPRVPCRRSKRSSIDKDTLSDGITETTDGGPSLIKPSSLLLNGQFFADEIRNRRETALPQHHEQNQAVKPLQLVTPTFLVIHVTF